MLNDYFKLLRKFDELPLKISSIFLFIFIKIHTVVLCHSAHIQAKRQTSSRRNKELYAKCIVHFIAMLHHSTKSVVVAAFISFIS